MILLVQYRLEEQGLTADRDRLRRCEALRSPARELEQQGGLWSAFRSTSNSSAALCGTSYQLPQTASAM